MTYTKHFKELRMADVPLVGGKNASLGQMIGELTPRGILIPSGFAVTARAYWYFVQENNLTDRIKHALSPIDKESDTQAIKKAGAAIRALFLSGYIPDDLAADITRAYQSLCDLYQNNDCDVAVRSSATAEDLPGASFAGQQETYLNIRGEQALLEACKKSMASLFTDRAISYRVQKGFDHLKVALSIGVQKMVRSDKACSGVAFSLDPETGFKDVITINSSYGLGESIVQGLVIPDEFCVHKPSLVRGFASIIKKQLGSKQVRIIYDESSDAQPIKTVDVSQAQQSQYTLSDDEIMLIARNIAIIEEHYSALNGTWTPMDVEWAKDGDDGRIYILQARPETVHALETRMRFHVYHCMQDIAQLKPLCSGQSIGQQMVTGTARVVTDASMINDVQKGDIIVTEMTDPDWVPAMKKAAGIVTNRGGRTCHAAIVSRELGVPALVGTQDATRVITSGQTITIDCSRGDEGYVYEGAIPFTLEEIQLDEIPQVPAHLMVNMADPARAFAASFLPVTGVGLARIEFIITNSVKIHPMALLHPEKLDNATRDTILSIMAPYTDGARFFIETLSRGIGMIAAAFYPRPVLVRFSDFKTNEYRNLVGGAAFEPYEENPMLGFRGAVRYGHERYKEAFALECAALVRAREVLGLDNIQVMIPFVRTLHEAREVTQVLERNGLKRKKDSLAYIMMCEIPSNVILIKEFAQLFDGFSIGSNDLTQLTLGVDRDSEILAQTFDERDPAVTRMISLAIEGAHAAQKTIGICGQAPSDYPEFAQFLIDCGIDSLSLNIDSVLPFMMRFAAKK